MRNTPHYAIIKCVIRLQCNLFLLDAINFFWEKEQSKLHKKQNVKDHKKKGVIIYN